MANSAGSPNVQIFIGGKKVADSNFLSYTVDRDMFQPDMAQIVLSNQGDVYSRAKAGDAVEIKVGDSETTIYKGDVIGLEPAYKGGEKTRMMIRAMNKLHLLLRKKKSRTWQDKTDQQILQQVVQDAGLTLEWKHEKSITYKHVYQHNQNDLEFLRMRAARMGCHVWCWDKTVYCKQPDLQSGPVATLEIDESHADHPLKNFTPRHSSSPIVKKMTVKGWNPETKELIQGDAQLEASPLGSEDAAADSGGQGDEESFNVDEPIWSKEEADALAKAKLQDLALQHITGEAEMKGDGGFDIGKIVQIHANKDPNAQPAEDPFNGKYYIMGISHRHANSQKGQGSNRGGGFTTVLRLARDAKKQ